jgi:putative ABC transport system permease protein
MEIGPILRAMSRNRIKVGLLVLEIAVTTAVVLNCLSMIQEQRQRIGRPSGIDEKNLMTVQIRPWGQAFADEGTRKDIVRRDLETLRAMPEVADASLMSPIPLQGGGSSGMYKALGGKDSDKVRAPIYNADEHVLSTLGLELVEGRALADTDQPLKNGPQILNCLVTRDFADAVFPGQSPIGKMIDSGNVEFPDVIVGVVARMVTPYGGGPMESQVVIYPAGPPGGSFISYVVRAKPGELEHAMGRVDDVLLGLQAERLVDLQTMAAVKGGGYALNAFVMRVLAVIAGLLLAVTALGIFGTTSFSVTQRTKQIGTRRALGASRAEILRYFLVENSLVSGIGIALGLAGAFALNVPLVTQFAGSKLGPGLTIAGVLLLWLVGVGATIVPARRASRLSPALATRSV